MTIATSTLSGDRRTLAIAVAALTVTQVIGWGSTFHVPAVLSARLAAGTGLSEHTVFGGVTMMLLVAAVSSPAVGRALDRDGCQRWMIAGSCLIACGLTCLAFADGPILFAVAWFAFGLAMPIALNQAASTALVQIAPDRARRGIALLLLLSGLSTTIAWPILISLDETIGWRPALLVIALVQLVVCVPLHAFGLPGGRPVAPASPGRAGRLPSLPPPTTVPGAFALAAVTFALSGMLTWGLPLHMIGILKDYGHTEATAVTIGALLGPGQVLARAFEMTGGQRLGILPVGVGSMAMMPIALAILLSFGTSAAGAVAFVICYGLSAGLVSIVRAVAPLRLFGAAAYAMMLGRLGAAQNVAFAVAPLGFALVRETFGSVVLVAAAFVCGLLCLTTMSILAHRAR